MTDVDWHCSSRGCKGGTKSFFVLSSRQWPPTCLFGYTFSHSHTPSLSPSFHSSRGKVGILGSPFSNFFSSLPFLSLSLFFTFPPHGNPPRRRRDSSGARVSSRWRNEIDRKDHDDIDDEGGGWEDRCRKYLCAGRNGFIGGGWSKRAIECSTEGLVAVSRIYDRLLLPEIR